MGNIVNRRILVIDDNESIHQDYRAILSGSNDLDELDDLEHELFASHEQASRLQIPRFELDSALQGQDGLALVEAACAAGAPYALAFVDMRMPPGWDGLETISRLKQSDPTLQMVICTAYSDRSWEELAEQVGETDNLLILKKPFDPIEVRQMAVAMTMKWAVHRQAQLKLSELNEMVQVRTHEIAEAKRLLELQNAQLEQARIVAEDANQTKSGFLANMSHELRTPMTAILGYAELLAADELAEHERTSAANTIKQNGEHLLSLINELLDLSKVEAKEVKLERLAFSPRALAEEIMSLLSVRAEEKRLTLDLKVADDVPEFIVSDPHRVRQIAVNLLGNSLKFTEEGGARLELSMVRGERDELSLDVFDTGIGMSPEQLAILFRPFTQAQASTTRRYGGTGLGLSLLKGLAELLGGQIFVESRIGEGSHFWIRIPVDPANATSEAYEAVPQAGVATAEKPSCELDPLNCKILLVEDTITNQRLVATILRKAGATVEVADNGQLGVESLRAAALLEEPFDLVLMDMQMPVLDGYDATRLLRREGVETPVIALTANAMAGDAEKCLDAGCDAYQTKPVDRARLLSTIRGLLK